MKKVHYTDFHLHLQDERFGGRVADVLRRCADGGICRLFVNSTCSDDWGRVQEIARGSSMVFPFYGVHPWFISDMSFCEGLRKLVQGCACGVGEVGLDLWKPGLDKTRQEDVFLYQLQLASELRRPLTIHCLKAFDWLLRILHDFRNELPVMIIHAFGGSLQQMRQLLDVGAYISFAASVLRPEKEKIRKCLLQVPLHRLLLESDSPDFLPPSGYILQPLADNTGASINTPENIPALYRFVAQLRGITGCELSIALEESARRIVAEGVRQRLISL